MIWLPLIVVSAQVTLVAAVGLAAGSKVRSAAHRHSVLLAVLLCILASPVFFAAAAWSGLTLNLPAIHSHPDASAPALTRCWPWGAARD